VETVRDNLPCVSCGYTLRGLLHDGNCPECGTEISRSLRGDLLAAADPKWLRTIVRGQRLLTIGLMTAVSGIVLMLLITVAYLFTAALSPGLPRIVEDSFTIVLGVIFLSVPIGMCIALVGIFFVTAQEGRDIERETAWSARNMARWSMLGAIVACVAAYSIHFLPVLGAMWIALDLFFRGVFIALLTVAGVALLKRVEALSRRVPNEKLADQIRKRWRFIRWAVPAAGIYLLIFPVFGFGGGGMRGGLIFIAPLGCLGFVAVIGLLVGSVRLTGMMRTCTRQFRLCLAIAEEHA
jgi:predicted RNA-binding Zn-ribbon protein involved in translation (DUF1610 family)